MFLIFSGVNFSKTQRDEKYPFRHGRFLRTKTTKKPEAKTNAKIQKPTHTLV
jgi:hypothetical protein